MYPQSTGLVFANFFKNLHYLNKVHPLDLEIFVNTNTLRLISIISGLIPLSFAIANDSTPVKTAPSPSIIASTLPESGIYQWEPQYYGTVAGKRYLLHAGSFRRTHLRFADIDGDHDHDLFVGKADGKIAFFENKGSDQNPDFILQTEALTAAYPGLKEGQFIQKSIDVKENAAPELSDLDGDGDLDLLIGSADGSITFYLNEGNPLLAVFEKSNTNLFSSNLGENTVPRVADINGDRAPDLIIGTHSGDIFLQINSGSRTHPLFCPPVSEEFKPKSSKSRCAHPPIILGTTKPIMDSTPAWVDIDQDGDFDLVAGKANGQLSFSQPRRLFEREMDPLHRSLLVHGYGRIFLARIL